MIEQIRKNYYSSFSEERFAGFKHTLDSITEYPTDFRVAEAPLFLEDDVVARLKSATEDIIEQLQSIAYSIYSQDALPANYTMSGEDDHPLFLQVDFALTKNDKGEIVPQLIELQGFPSMYGYQVFYLDTLQQYYKELNGLTSYFSGFDKESYTALLKKAIVGDEDPEQVILLEIDPHLQKTRIDFAMTEKLLGIKTINLRELVTDKDSIYYKDGAKYKRIKRIYNRVIFDELERKQIQFPFNFRRDYNFTWVGHPHWYYKISKYTLPFLRGEYVPECKFLSDVKQLPENLADYVLKPLFSFAGTGVEVSLTREKLESIRDKQNFILQKKIVYAPILETPDEPAKAEIRMMVLWDDSPKIVNNLVRLSKGAMMGVDFNKNKTWVGSTCALHSGTL